MTKGSGLDKKAVSAVVATVLIIMITVAAVGIVWAVVIPMVRENLGSSMCDEVDISISTVQGFTCYDSTKKIVSVQIKKGANEVNVSGINFILSSEGNSYSENLSYIFSQNEYHTFYVSSSTLNAIDSVSVAPVLKNGKVCSDISLVGSLSDCANLGSVETINDGVYPKFSKYFDNTGVLPGKGKAWFNVTVENTNGTVLLEINGINIVATNLSANIYNVSYDFVTNGTYYYKWHSWGNGTDKNYGFSDTRNYFIEFPFLGGEGSMVNPYQIASWKDLNNVRYYLDSNFILTRNLGSGDIDYTGLGDAWEPIGTSGFQFKGSFNGNGKIISNLNISRVALAVDYVGLFGYANMSNISNLGLEMVNIVGYSASTVYSYIGCITGVNRGLISNSFCSGKVTGANDLTIVGGLVGTSTMGIVNNSYSIINASGASVGGIVGTCTYTNITNSYFVGNLSVSSRVGPIISAARYGLASYSYWDKNVSGITSSLYGTGKTTEQMKDPLTFSTWDSNVWNLTSGNYPKLKWQN